MSSPSAVSGGFPRRPGTCATVKNRVVQKLQFLNNNRLKPLFFYDFFEYLLLTHPLSGAQTGNSAGK
jgi:hypothetical protein